MSIITSLAASLQVYQEAPVYQLQNSLTPGHKMQSPTDNKAYFMEAYDFYDQISNLQTTDSANTNSSSTCNSATPNQSEQRNCTEETTTTTQNKDYIPPDKEIGNNTQDYNKPTDIDRESQDVDACLESYESCKDDGAYQDYDDFTLKNRTLGTIAMVFAFLPTIFMWLLVWPYDSRLNALFIEDHLLYFVAWNTFYGSQLIIFAPFVWIWVSLSLQDPDNWSEGDINFYKSWLLDIIMVFSTPMWFLNVATFCAIVILDWSKEDDFYSSIVPVIISIFITIFGGITTFFLNEFNFAARNYYDPVLRQRFFDYKDGKQQAKEEALRQQQIAE